MDRFLYEHSVPYGGYLIIPFALGIVGGETIYSYKLLSELGHKGQFHRAENPAGICEASLDGVIRLAQVFLEASSDIQAKSDYFKYRYTYRKHLIIAIHELGHWFYDHYPPNELKNIAAPKLFKTEYECLNWVKQGLDYNAKVDSP